MEKKAFLLLNGEPPNRLPNLSNYDIVCVADGAYKYLKNKNIKPHFIAGDLDSLGELPSEIKVIHKPNQNFTDFYKILKILFTKGFSKVDVFGGSGREQDHFLGNLSTVIRLKKKLKVTFYDEYGHYFLANKKTILNNCKDKTISLVPFKVVKNIVTKGLKYPLYKENLTFGKKIGTRNFALKNKVEITFESGNLFIFINTPEVLK